VLFSAVFHVEHQLTQLMPLSTDFSMSGNGLGLKWPLYYIGRKRTLRPLPVKHLQLDIECPTQEGR
jgi:hypothetical protein